MHAALIVNPKSGRASGKGLALAEKLKGDRHVAVGVLDKFHRLPDLLDEYARQGVTELFVSSGDGTIHAIQTLLAGRPAFTAPPRLILLPHGTTNMTAADLGFRNHSLEAQAAFIRDPEPRDVQNRATLRVPNPRDGKPRLGMFMGGGAVAEATAYCQVNFNDKGVKGNWAGFATLARMMADAMFGPPRGHASAHPVRPYRMTVRSNGKTFCTGDQSLMMATTLQRLILNTRPFWGGHSAPIRVTIMPYPHPSLLRWTLPIMYGGEQRRMAAGVTSFCGETIAVSLSGRYVMDGEFFDGPEHEPLRIETGPSFTYVRG